MESERRIVSWLIRQVPPRTSPVIPLILISDILLMMKASRIDMERDSVNLCGDRIRGVEKSKAKNKLDLLCGKSEAARPSFLAGFEM